jgi:putative ABC transport system permease protein
VPTPPLTGLSAALFRALLPSAEREEVLEDLASEYADRAAAHGRLSARVWLWRQIFGSVPALLRRSWWRGWSGFEPRANRLNPGGFPLESWIMDLRYSARRLAGRPAYALLAVLTLALGAGGTAAIFSVVRALLLDPFPVARESELGVLWMPGWWNEEEFLFMRSNVPGFSGIAAIRPMDPTLEMPGAPLRVLRGIGTSAELFDVLGAKPLIGRTFRSGDDVPGAEPVAVLSHGIWQELGGDPAIVGRQLRLGGVPRTIVGVMPPGFWFPNPSVKIWTPMPLNPENRAGNYAFVVRVADGFRIDRMDGPLQAIAARIGERFQYLPQFDKSRNPGITPLREHLVGDVRPSVLATLAAMGLILLIACVNVSALMLGQVGGRSTELAVRTALGAGRQRLLQQVVIESLLIGFVAGAAGALLAAGVFRVLVGSLPLGELAATAQLDWTVFAAATIVALVAASAVALIPGIALWRGNLQGAMATTRSGGISARGGRLEATLVVAQIALAVLLSTGAALLIRSVANLRALDTGLLVDRVAVVDTTMPTELSMDRRLRAILDAMPALASLPHVRAAGATMKLPLRGQGQDWGMGIEGRPEVNDTTYVRLVTHDYFDALGMEIKQGRGFLPSDRAGTERAVVINEALAAKFFPGDDPIGRMISTGFEDGGERIVGIVENVAEANLTDGAVPARYMLYDQVPYIWHQVTFVLAADRPESVPAALQAARATLPRESPKLAIDRLTTMEIVFDEAVGPAGQVVNLLSLLAALALVLGAVGVYGMISHFVSRRTRDYGIRIAMGLPPQRLVSQVMGRGLRLVAFGSAVGIAAAIALTRLLSSLLYGVQPADLPALAGAVLALFLVGSLAAWIPARRASRTDPALVLRQQ